MNTIGPDRAMSGDHTHSRSPDPTVACQRDGPPDCHNLAGRASPTRRARAEVLAVTARCRSDLDSPSAAALPELVERLAPATTHRAPGPHIAREYACRWHGYLSIGSIHHVRRTLSKALNDAVRRGQLARNPVAAAHTPQYVPPAIEPLTATEARTILSAARGEPNGAAFVLALSLGLRRGEVLALRWRDVDFDFDRGRLRISGSLSRRTWQHGCADAVACSAGNHHTGTGCRRHRGPRNPAGCPQPCPPDCQGHAQRCPHRRAGGLVIDATKTAKSQRILPLPGPLRAVLAEHRQHQDTARALAADLWQDNDLVFTGARGQPVDPNRHSEHWQDFLKRIGVRPARLHDARHTTATLLLVQGVDQRVVMDLFGWTSGTMANR